MAAPTETPPATTATEPEVAKDAKETKDATLTVDVAAAANKDDADKGDTKQQPPESPEIVTPGGTILAKVPEPETGLCSIGVSGKRKSPTPDEDKKAEDDKPGDEKGDDDAPKEVSESVKRAREAAETLEEALKSDGDKKAADEEPPAKKAAVEEAPKEEETAVIMPPAVQRQMTTLSPEAAVGPPSLQREATVAA